MIVSFIPIIKGGVFVKVFATVVLILNFYFVILGINVQVSEITKLIKDKKKEKENKKKYDC